MQVLNGSLRVALKIMKLRNFICWRDLFWLLLSLMGYVLLEKLLHLDVIATVSTDQVACISAAVLRQQYVVNTRYPKDYLETPLLTWDSPDTRTHYWHAL